MLSDGLPIENISIYQLKVSMIYQISNEDFDLVLNKGIKLKEARDSIKINYSPDIFCYLDFVKNSDITKFKVYIRSPKESTLEKSVRKFVSLAGLPTIAGILHNEPITERIFLLKKIGFFKKYFGSEVIYPGKEVIGLK